jgi:cytosine/uracil/thiamine/allantoin permease
MTLSIAVGRSKRAKQPKVRKAVLVYQAGLANVFAVDSFNMADYGRNARRLMQYDFRTCEAFAQGLAAAGVLVASAACNQAGEIANARWSEDLNAQPFSDKFKPVFAGVAHDSEREEL